MDLSASHLWMLTGTRRAGKTSFCRFLVSNARAAGWDVAGLLSPAVIENGVKTGILAEDLRTGKTRPLARAASTSDLRFATFDLPLGNWYFDRAALDWGNLILETCLPCDLLIVDELGPLELLRGAGWDSALVALRQPRYRLGLVVVRTGLQESAVAVLPIRGTIPLEGSLAPEAEAQAWWAKIIHEQPA